MTSATVEPPVGLRAKRRAEARDALVDAALTLMKRRSFDGVSVEEIADHAGVSRRTFFRYFETKESVLLDRRRSQLAAFEVALASAPPAASPLQAIEQAFVVLGRDYQLHRERILLERTLFERSRDLGARDHQIDRAFEEAIVAFLTRAGGSRTATRHARYFAAATMAVLRVAVTEWAEGGGRANLITTARPAFALLARLMP